MNGHLSGRLTITTQGVPSLSTPDARALGATLPPAVRRSRSTLSHGALCPHEGMPTARRLRAVVAFDPQLLNLNWPISDREGLQSACHWSASAARSIVPHSARFLLDPECLDVTTLMHVCLLSHPMSPHVVRPSPVLHQCLRHPRFSPLPRPKPTHRESYTDMPTICSHRLPIGMHLCHPPTPLPMIGASPSHAHIPFLVRIRFRVRTRPIGVRLCPRSKPHTTLGAQPAVCGMHPGGLCPLPGDMRVGDGVLAKPQPRHNRPLCHAELSARSSRLLTPAG